MEKLESDFLTALIVTAYVNLTVFFIIPGLRFIFRLIKGFLPQVIQESFAASPLITGQSVIPTEFAFYAFVLFLILFVFAHIGNLIGQFFKGLNEAL